MNETSPVLLQIENRIATLTVTREKALNALNLEVLQALKTHIEDLSAKSFEEVRVIVLRGAGEKAFVAGADIKLMREADDNARKEFINLGQSVMNALESSKLPSIAVVQGFALGGGMELALACDLIVAGVNASFGQPEVNLGLLPGFGGTQRLRQRVGTGLSKRLIFTGDSLSAEDAHRAGIVDVLCDDSTLEETAHKLATKLSRKAPLAIAAAKRAIQVPYAEVTAHGLEREVEEFLSLFQHQDTREGLDAFIEKRKPNFEGK